MLYPGSVVITSDGIVVQDFEGSVVTPEDILAASDDESVLNKTVSEVGMVMPLSPWAYAYDRCFVACGCVRVLRAARAWICDCMGASMRG